MLLKWIFYPRWLQKDIIPDMIMFPEGSVGKITQTADETDADPHPSQFVPAGAPFKAIHEYVCTQF